LLRLEEHRLLLADARLQAGYDLRDLVAVRRRTLQVLPVVDDRVLQIAHVDVRARDVVEDVGVRQDVVSLLQLLDARVVVTLGDRAHPLLEMAACLRALVRMRGARRQEEQRSEGESCG